MRSTEDLINNILHSSQIPSGKRRADIQRELRSHIEDFVTAQLDAGRDPVQIEQLVTANFGDPAQIASNFAWVYRHERRRLRVFVYALSTAVLTISLLAGILTMQTGIALSFGTPVMKVLVSRHTLIEALDILASVAVYLGLISLERLFKAYRFQKAALLLATALAILTVSCTTAGLRTTFLIYGLVNGIFFRAVQLYVQPKPARIAIVLFCFPVAGLIFALQWQPASQIASLIATCASWLVMGAGYQLMTDLAARVDSALLKSLKG